MQSLTAQICFDPSNWAPLLLLLTNRQCADFMYMGVTTRTEMPGTAAAIHMYKHVNTRRYLNIDAAGQTYKYNAPTGGYYSIPVAEAIAAVHA